MSEKSEERFRFQVKETEGAILERMSEYEQVLRSGAALINASDDVTRSGWKTFVKTLKLEQFYPGIQGYGFSVKLHPNEVQKLNNQVRAEGFPNFAVWPDSARDEYHSIIFLEPFAGRNLRAFGFDMFTEATRRKAMERARDSGKSALSEMVTLVQETHYDVQKGCLLYLPVYTTDSVPRTLDERRATLKGFVYSPFRFKDLMNGILDSGTPDIEFELYDGRLADTSKLLYATNGVNHKKSKAKFTTSSTINFAGNQWYLVFTSKPGFVSQFETRQPHAIAIAGLIVNLSLLVVLIKINSLSRKNKFLAERYKTEKERYDIVADSTNDVLWDWDIQTNTIRWNHNYSKVFGHTLSSVDNPITSWERHLHPSDRQRVLDKVQDTISTGKQLWLDEYRFIKADEETIYLLNRGRIIHDEKGTPVRLVGSMIDITQQKAAEESQKRFSEELEITVKNRTAELQRSNEELERFAHVASHDLQEPVRKILTFADLIQTKYGTALGEGTVVLEKISRAAARLKSMIRGILAYSTVTAAHQVFEDVDLNITIENVKEDLEILISEKKANVAIATTLPTVRGNSVLLHQLFLNLINNSLKFARSEESPYIEIAATSFTKDSDLFAEITITDNGIGFDMRHADAIFQSFVRLHSKDVYEGTGLGLAFCKRIVETHNGTITADGKPGLGATFIIHLPLTQTTPFS